MSQAGKIVQPLQSDDCSVDPSDFPQLLHNDAPEVSTFRIRMLGAISGGAGIAGDLLFFQIGDVINQLTAFYCYVGGGLGASVSWMPPVSGTTAGPWNFFSTVTRSRSRWSATKAEEEPSHAMRR
jgi:hypothetical protein